MQDALYFAHISDSHIGPEPSYERHGHNSLSCATKAVALLNELPQTPDFIIHTGDIVTDPDPDAYKIAAETFSALKPPTYYVNGNHDNAADIWDQMNMGPIMWRAPDGRLTYRFEVKGFRCLVLDAKGPIDPQGRLTNTELDLLERECAGEGEPLILFTHFPLLPMNSPWMDSHMLIENGMVAHEILSTASHRLRGVYHGHIHQNMQTARDGVNYISVASLFAQFAAWPVDIETRYDLQHPPGYNFVHLLPEQTIVHQHTFERP